MPGCRSRLEENYRPFSRNVRITPSLNFIQEKQKLVNMFELGNARFSTDLAKPKNLPGHCTGPYIQLARS
jgi:hypothetical protein